MIQFIYSRRLAILVCLVALFLGFSTTAMAQQSRSVNVGTFNFSTNEVLTQDDISWPRDQLETDRNMLDVYGYIIGVNRTWTDATGVTRPIQIAQVANRKFSDIELVTPAVPGAFSRTYRNPYPNKVIDGHDWTDILGGSDPVDSNAPADVVVFSHINTWTGIDMERWAYGFANDDYDDFVILEHVFTNTSGEVRNDVYLGIQAETSAHAYYPADLWGNYYGATYRQYVAGDATADSLRLWYSWDADQTSAFPTIDTRGEPDEQWGNFREVQFMGHMVLHCDASPSNEADDPAQPRKAGFSQRELAPDLNVAGHEDIYAYLSEGWDPANQRPYSMTIDGEGNLVPDATGPYRILDPDLDINNTTAYDPLTEQEKTNLMAFGPYTLQPGEDIRVVTALVGGSIPHRWAIDAGRAYGNGNPAQFALVPLPYNIRNPWTNAVVAQTGSTLDKATKNAVLDLSKLFLFDNAGKANSIWKNGNVNQGAGTFNVPLAPATPSLQAFSENDQTRLAWGNEAASDSRGGTIANYRIYREYTRPAALEIPTDTTFILHDEVPASAREYIDTDVIRGQDYYYYVVAVNTLGVESSPYLNRTGTASDKVLEAVAPTRGADPGWEDNVVVVPNPFHIQGADNYQEARRLNFLNLPAYANIHIYTVTGDLIQTLHHDSSTGDQDWEKQDTFSTMEIVSGVYIYVVEELGSPRGSATGKQAIGKFVVIK